jgi:hypothetical protein
MQSFDPSNLERGSAPSACSTQCAASPNFLRACEDGGKRCSGSAKASTIRWPKYSVLRAATNINAATRDAISAAAQANVNIFALDPRGLIGMTTDFVENMRAGAPDVMGTDRNRPVGTPASGTQALLGEMRLTQDSLRTLAESTEASRLSIRTPLTKPSAASPTRTAGTICSGTHRLRTLATGDFHHIEVKARTSGPARRRATRVSLSLG